VTDGVQSGMELLMNMGFIVKTPDGAPEAYRWLISRILFIL
jgi:hypothetical protein